MSDLDGAFRVPFRNFYSSVLFKFGLFSVLRFQPSLYIFIVMCFPPDMLNPNVSHIFIIAHIYLSICLSVCPAVHPSIHPQSFLGPWPLFQFLNPIHSR
jgi:hypothetical protein